MVRDPSASFIRASPYSSLTLPPPLPIVVVPARATDNRSVILLPFLSRLSLGLGLFGFRFAWPPSKRRPFRVPGSKTWPVPSSIMRYFLAVFSPPPSTISLGVPVSHPPSPPPPFFAQLLLPPFCGLHSSMDFSRPHSDCGALIPINVCGVVVDPQHPGLLP